MKLWKRAVGALKDQNSLLISSLSRQNSYRNADLEAAIIKATSHDEGHVDYRNAQRVFTWIRMSPVNLKPLIWALTKRMEKTQSWVVAIKGLMLIHGVFYCKVPAMQRIGRLPFDLSNFTDGHSKPRKMWGFNAFVRSYFAFLDQRSALLYIKIKQTDKPVVEELVKLENLQILLDLLLQIKPMGNNMKEGLILEAMDCVIIEIFDVYSRICDGIAKVLLRICSAGKLEATMALSVLQKATTQGEDLALYYAFCRDFGVFNAMEIPKVSQIPKADIRDLERIIHGVSERINGGENIVVVDDDNKAMVQLREDVVAAINVDKQESKSGLETIITEKWVAFTDDLNVIQGNQTSKNNVKPFDENPPCYLPLTPVNYKHEVPDFISFY